MTSSQDDPETIVTRMAEYLIDNLLSDPDPKKIDVLKWLESADPKATYK